ncbi:hypothetical protein [Halorhabdus salina]|uniref:hypothetical protein n=1 Tax=Halorhabdus salina TaxID=2750670 RepID=UPI002867DB9F|nr:hypothetical protein [Halorhabdus salina]
MTDRADTTNPQESPSKGQSLKCSLTERDGVALREEVRDWDALDGDRPTTWRRSVRRWRTYIEDTDDTDTVLRNDLTGEYAAGSSPHRFAEEYANKQYAKLKDLERALRDEYGKRLHTAMLTLTGSSTDDDGNPIPPVDHLHDLDASWEAVRRELSRQLEDRRWEYLAILEPHVSGYLHIHIAVFVEGVVTRDDFAPVIEAHLRNCPIAGRDAHDTADDSTISINRVGLDRRELHAAAEGIEYGDSIGNLGTYLAEYLGTHSGDPLDAPDHQQMANAVLWATGKQRWRPSQGAQSYMASEQPDDDDSVSEWSLHGIVQGTEFHRVHRDDTGGVDRFVTSTDRPPD